MRRSKFSLSHYRLLTCDMGELIPLTWFEALPGDTVQQATSALVRVAPMLAPVMHPVMIRIHHWFVPNRLIWEDWEDFITGGDDGNFVAVPPFIDFQSDVETGSLADYLGVPVGTSGNINALPFRAFSLIFNEHYRDQDLVSERAVGLSSGQDSTTSVDMVNVAWEKDYFTTARPWEQKGEDVVIPIGSTAPVKGMGKHSQTFEHGAQTVYESDGSEVIYDPSSAIDGTSGTNVADAMYVRENPDQAGYPGIYADLSQATGITVNELREALAKQRYMEARAQYGSRYVEYLRYLGVRSSDARLQNPEYLGGGRQVIQFSEVLQTGPDAGPGESYVGDLKGHGIAALRSNRYRRFFEEHGVVMSCMSVVPKSIYQTAMDRKWHRQVKEDYFQKELQFLGDQVIENKEIQSTHTDPDGTFGFQSRYNEYRTLPSKISGEFNDVLNYWHLAREFEGDVALNASFVTSVPSKRIYASTDTDSLYVMANHSIQARRLLKRDPRPRTF